MSDAERNAELIVGRLTAAGVTIAASLPDSWVSTVIDRIDAEETIRHVRVTREDDGVANCGAARGLLSLSLGAAMRDPPTH